MMKRRLNFMVLVILAILPLAKLNGQEEEKPMTTDEMLQYTFDDLRDRMEEAVAANQSLAAKNEALRKRMLMLKQEIREVENEKIRILEQTMEVTDLTKLEKREIALAEDKLKNLYGERIHLQEEQKRYQQLLAESEAQKNRLPEEARRLENEFKELRKDKGKGKVKEVSRTKGAKDEQYKYRLLLKEAERRTEGARQELVHLGKRAAKPTQQRDLLLKRQAQLQQRKAAQEEVASSLKEEGEHLARMADEIKEKRKGTLKGILDEINRWKWYRNELNKIIEAIKAAHDAVNSDYGAFMNKMREQESLLARERQSLQQAAAIVEQSVKLAQELKEQPGQSARPEDAALQKGQERLAALRQDMKDLRAKVQQEQDRQKTLSAGQANLGKEIGKLTDHFRRLEKQAQVQRPAVLKAKDPQSVKALKEGWQKGQKVQRERDLAKGKTDQLERQFNQLKEKNQALAQKRDSLVPAIATDTSGEQISDQPPTTPDRDETAETRKEIEALRLRKTALSSSLEAVQNRYNTDSLAIQDFEQQEQELKEYLAILKEENTSLQEKVLNLMVAVDNLQAERGSLTSEQPQEPQEDAGPVVPQTSPALDTP